MEKRFVKISYTGKVKDSQVFDTTDAETAKKENIFDAKRIYQAVPMIIGELQVLKGLDEELTDMKAGEEKELDIPPEKAYGQKDPNLIRLVPMKIFKQEKMTPIPGMVIELDGRPARIQTVSGGRVRVDFNSELAGKTLSYKVKIVEEAKTQEQKIKYLIERKLQHKRRLRGKTQQQGCRNTYSREVVPGQEHIREKSIPCGGDIQVHRHRERCLHRVLEEKEEGRKRKRRRRIRRR